MNKKNNLSIIIIMKIFKITKKTHNKRPKMMKKIIIVIYSKINYNYKMKMFLDFQDLENNSNLKF